jgi:hypothetical protein
MPQSDLIGTELIGTWRVVSFERYDKDGAATQPFGAPPCGYAVFDATGRAFVVLGKATEGVAADVAKSLMAYFGPFTVSAAGDVLSVAVESSNMPDYIGSTQIRHVEVTGDTLTVGTPGQYQAKLERVR